MASKRSGSSSSAPRGRSGNPARAAEAERLAKQRKSETVSAKAEYEENVRKRRRGIAAWWAVGSVAAVAVAALIAWSFITTPWNEYDIASVDPSSIEGVETFDNGTDHVTGEVDYPQNPPAGGPHNQAWLNCGVYTEVQEDEHAVHSLEHGAVWITYDADSLTDAEVERLREYVPGGYGLMSPYEGMDTPIAVSAWNAQLKLDSVDDSRIEEFFQAYWRSPDVPEPGASCTGAIDGPGRL
ncbi:DUF3105 domain-containing protein [Microbacterium sp. JB110]|uniref:DUF3105 domain-containing protein n=1 Tax=Microbacterium sp. JB110 TaxID=2024477 RepID=UPI00097F539D|nr:DUF3105 domain-containing protein [Microbacterium sp. JB110]RCS61331.1 DUF3105 domain-containing protein [Microbacterium sp. JB110]SJM50727.1 hypothetical protein CZ774_04745 [Frigoribacterium sp. JB110]